MATLRFRVVRPDDLLAVEFETRGLVLEASDLGPPRLVRPGDDGLS